MAETLYTPEILSLAVSLARWPFTADLPLVGEARSQSCGSTLKVGLACENGAIARIGMAAQACAVGQAAAAIMAEAAVGHTRAEFAAAEAGLKCWLAGEGAMPDWPGLATIAPARAYPARHGAILLGWRAVLAALDN